MPRPLWPAQTISIGFGGMGPRRQSDIWKKRPLKSERPVLQRSFITCTYSEQ